MNTPNYPRIKVVSNKFAVIEHRRCGVSICEVNDQSKEISGFTSPRSAQTFLQLVLDGHKPVTTYKKGNYYSCKFDNKTEVNALARASVPTEAFEFITGGTVPVKVNSTPRLDESQLPYGSVNSMIDEIRAWRQFTEKNLTTEFACVIVDENSYPSCVWVPPTPKVELVEVVQEKTLTDEVKSWFVKVMFESNFSSKSEKTLFTQCGIVVHDCGELVEWLESNGQGRKQYDYFLNYTDEYVMNPPSTVSNFNLLDFDILSEQVLDYVRNRDEKDVLELIGQFVGYCNKFFPNELTEFVNL